MVNYQLGKIYRIVCNTTGQQYIGSTCETTLARRLTGHKHDHKRFQQGKGKYISSVQILDGNNYEILLIENFPCGSKDELTARERFYIETMPCVNRAIPTRTMKEWGEANRDKKAEYDRQFREANKVKIAEQTRQYREAHREKLAEYNRQYNEANKEQIAERKRQYKYRQYREANKVKIAERKRQHYIAKKEQIAERLRQMG